MTQKEQNGVVILQWLNMSLIFQKWDFDSFKESLVLTKHSTTTKITLQDLKFSDFSCLFYKHEPNYSNKEQSVLNVKFLMNNFQWSSQNVAG